MQIAGITDRGRVRPINQDAIGFDAAAASVVVADGVGGQSRGEVASAMAVEIVLPILREINLASQHLPESDMGLIRASIREGVIECNTRICARAVAEAGCLGMSTTLAAGLFGQGHLFHCHLGDSRIYCYRRDRLMRLTKDHSLVQELRDAGIRPGPFAPSNVITRALGDPAECEPDCGVFTLQQGDLFLFCSDGLTNCLSDAMIAGCFAGGPNDVDRIARELVDAANTLGGPDNISVVVVRPH